MNRQTGQTGFTLIELLLYVALIGILLSAITSLFITTTEARVKNESIAEVDEQGAYAMEVIAQSVRNGTSITSPTAGVTAAGFTIVVPTGALSPTILSLASGALQIKEGAGATIALTNSNVQATSLSVTNLTRSGTTGIMQINFTLSRVNSTGRNQYDYQKTFTTSVGIRP